MKTVRVVPCLDVDAGRVVKGVRFVELRDAGAQHADRGKIWAHGVDFPGLAPWANEMSPFGLDSGSCFANRTG